MRRLKTSQTHRLHDEEGATAVVVALSLVMLFGFGALAIDVGQIYQERRELQNGADAAVLAAAQDCADPTTAGACVVTAAGAGNCAVTTAALENRIDEYANANANDGESSACVADLGSDFITVETETLSGGDGFLTHWLAGVIGNPTTTVTARATAAWGTPGGANTIPLTFSYCEWTDLVPDVTNLPSASETIYFHTASTPDGNSASGPGEAPQDCIGPAGLDTPGGFGWLDTDSTDECQAWVNSDAQVDGDTGTPIPTAIDPGCDEAFWKSLVDEGHPFLIPIFDGEPGPPGANAKYDIVGFAGFVLEGYRLSGSKAYNYFPPPECKGDDRCVHGQFTHYVTYADYLATSGSTDFGATAVVLTE